MCDISETVWPAASNPSTLEESALPHISIHSLAQWLCGVHENSCSLTLGSRCLSLAHFMNHSCVWSTSISLTTKCHDKQTNQQIFSMFGSLDVMVKSLNVLKLPTKPSLFKRTSLELWTLTFTFQLLNDVYMTIRSRVLHTYDLKASISTAVNTLEPCGTTPSVG